ncbi:MAG: DUF4091 domain-containing protein [Sedimentisphaerales bacterium]|nr:DUF4091 domain-containing protein [Sedimentisphaerales bacterium]
MKAWSIIVVNTAMISLMVFSSAVLAATPSAYYDRTWSQLAADAQTYLDGAGKSSQGYAVGVVPPLTRVFREGSADLTFGGSITMSVARGESEYRELALVQVIGNAGLEEVVVTATELFCPQAEWPLEMQAGTIGYVQADSQKYSAEFAVPELMIEASGFSVDPNDMQSIYVMVDVPVDADPGTYTGQVTIAPDGKTAEVVNVSVEVLDFEIPYGGALQSHIFCARRVEMRDQRFISAEWSPPFSDLVDITPQEWNDAAASVAAYFAIPGNNFMIIRNPVAQGANGAIVGGDINGTNTYTTDEINQMKAFWAGMADILADQGLLDCAAVWVYDEPTTLQKSYAETVCEWVHDADSRLQTLLTDLGTLGSPICRDLRTSGDVNIHVIHTTVYDHASDGPGSRNGQDVWLYETSSVGSTDYPNHMVDAPPTAQRVLLWQLQDIAAGGYLHWESQKMFWDDQSSGDVYNLDAWPGSTNLGDLPVSGDGTLMHPSPAGGWCPALRLQNLTDGMEDIYCAGLLETLLERSDPVVHPQVPDDATWQAARAAGQSALTQFATATGGSDFTAYETNPATIVSIRQQINQAIVTLNDLLGPQTCADGANRFGADVSGPVNGMPDCYVNLYDLAFLAGQWLWCSDPADPDCDEFWPKSVSSVVN